MRLLETIFLVLVVFSSINLVLLKNQKTEVYLPLAANIMAVLSIIFEGYRIHIAPALILSAALLIRSLFKTLTQIKINKVIKSIGFIILIPMLIASIILPLLFPVVQLPKPSGSYPVGTQLMSFSDISRKEQLSDSMGYRNIPVQAWYPASDVSGKKRAKWINSKYAISLFSKLRHLPNVFDHLTLVKTHSYLNASVSEKEEKYPVILFSGGAAMFNGQNVIQAEELASHGYIVFAVGHPYEDFACMYPDETIIPYSEKQSVALSADTKSAVEIAKQTVADVNSPEFYRTILRNAKLNNASARLWSKDLSFIADKSFEMNRGMINNSFIGKLDISNIGAFGHSFGGASAGQLCLEDSRVKAFINMDGSPFGDAPDNEIQQPFMILTNEGSKNTICNGYSAMEKNFLVVQITGAEHMNFSDINSLMPLLGKLSGFLGDIKEKRQSEIMNNYIIDFFDKYLKNQQAPLLDNPSSPYPEVKVIVQ